MNENKYWVWLTMVFGISNRRIWEAMRLFESAVEAYNELSSGAMNDRLNQSEIENIRNTDLKKASDLVKYCDEHNISVIGYSSEEYPPQLRHIFNPPAVLYCRGNIACVNGKKTVTSVGARRACDYSIRAASSICRELAKSGVTIVSGFALGIDIASHLAAVSVNRPTACVLGCGVDVDYPKENFKFRDEILSNGGVFISEYPPGTPPNSPNFPKRNRILAGLGRAAIVFEASGKSGSLITAGMALEQGREVFCLPPADIFSDSFSGNITFLRDGATAVYSASDVLDCFRIGGAVDKEIRTADLFKGVSSFAVSELATKSGKKSEQTHELSEIPRKTKKDKKRKTDKKSEESKTDSPAENKSEENIQRSYEGLSETQYSIIKELEKSALHADILAVKLGIDTAELMTELTELEILGEISSLPGKMFTIA